MSYPFIIQGNNVTVVVDNKPHTISKTHVTYNKVVEAIKSNDWDTVKELIEPKQAVINYGRGNVTVVDDEILWKGEPFDNALSVRMIQMLQDGFTIEPMVNFMENLMQNPSKRSVTELYGFLEKNNLPITPDGCFLAYKKVRGDYKDVYSGTMDNSVGQVVSMERNSVDDDKDRTCSVGLHFCSEDYLKSFGGERLMILKINPRDVVSIPSDYNNAKGRCCKYEVVGEVDINSRDNTEFTRPVQSNANSVKREPKLGSTLFYKGYSDGFYEREFDYSNSFDRNYNEGYDKGYDDAQMGVGERYRHVAPRPTPSTPSEAWPFKR